MPPANLCVPACAAANKGHPVSLSYSIHCSQNYAFYEDKVLALPTLYAIIYCLVMEKSLIFLLLLAAALHIYTIGI